MQAGAQEVESWPSKKISIAIRRKAKEMKNLKKYKDYVDYKKSCFWRHSIHTLRLGSTRTHSPNTSTKISGQIDLPHMWEHWVELLFHVFVISSRKMLWRMSRMLFYYLWVLSVWWTIHLLLKTWDCSTLLKLVNEAVPSIPIYMCAVLPRLDRFTNLIKYSTLNWHKPVAPIIWLTLTLAVHLWSHLPCLVTTGCTSLQRGMPSWPGAFKST